MHYFSSFVYHPQNSVTLNNSPVKFSSSNFTRVYLDDVVGTSNLSLLAYLSSIESMHTSLQ